MPLIESASSRGAGANSASEDRLREIERPWPVADLSRRAELCREALLGVCRRKETRIWAILKAELANSLFLSPDRDERFEEEAIVAYREAITAWPREEGSARAEVEIGLASAYAERRGGVAEDNVSKGLRCIRNALGRITTEAAPALWARALSIRGDLFLRRSTDASSLSRAVAAYRKALEIQARHTDPKGCIPAMLDLGNALLARHSKGRPEDLEEAIGIFRRLVEVCDPADRNWARALTNLGISLHWRGDSASKDEAVRSIRQVVLNVSRRREPESWAKAHHLLGYLLVERHGENRTHELEEAILAFHRALRVWRPEADLQAWAETKIELAQTLLDRHLGNPGRNVERAIRHLRDVLPRARGSAKDEWVDALALLGRCLMERSSGNRLENFEEAIHILKRVLRSQSLEGDPESQSSTLCDLADAYSGRPRGNRARNLEIAIAFGRRSLNLLPRSSSKILSAIALRTLGNCLQDRLRGGKSNNLEEAIRCHHRALKIFSADANSYEWALTLSDLGNAMRSQFREDRAGSLELAIEAYERALTVLGTDSYPQERARTLMSLGVAFAERLLGEPDKNLENAIAALEESLSLQRAVVGVGWSDTMLNLGSVYQDARRKDRPLGIEQAIDIYRRLLLQTKRRMDPLAWAEANLNLGTAYSDRTLGDPADNFERAIAAYRRALAVMTRVEHPIDWALVQFNLGEAFERRILGKPANNRRKAMEAYVAALTVHEPGALPIECRRSAWSLGKLCLQGRDWRRASAAFVIALRSADVLYRASLLGSSREIELSAFPEIHRFAAYALARVGREGEALVALETGRARRIGEALDRDRADLAAIGRSHRALQRRYLQAIGRLQQLERMERSIGRSAWRDLVARRGLEPLRAESRQIRGLLASVVASIRKLPGHEDFQKPLDAHRIAASLRPEGCLAYVNVTVSGAQILLLVRTREGRARRAILWEDAFDSETLDDLLSQWRSQAPFGSRLPPILKALGALVAPLSRELRRRKFKRITLIPCGSLSLFPLHAARYRTEAGETTLLDEFEVSYAPSARLLASSQEALRSLRSGARRLVGVGNPELPKEVPLVFAGGELALISRLFPGERNGLLFGKAARRETLLQSLPEASHLHLACHGRFVEEDPLASYLLLAGGETLTAREFIFEGSLTRTRLAVLAACQSARTDILRLPDEGIGLPSVFLQAGIPGVIGTLWPVDDVATGLVMIRFYELLLDGEDGGPPRPVEALRQAQLWLRDVRAREIFGFFKEQRRVRESGGLHLDASAIAAGLSRFALEEPGSRPFEDPFFWAPFVFVGV